MCLLSARFSLELSECKVCLPCEVILEWIKVYKVRRSLGPEWLSESIQPIDLVWRPRPLVEKLLSGGGIKVTKEAWRVPSW